MERLKLLHNKENNLVVNWGEKQDDYLADLLYVMLRYFKYNLDKIILKRGGYIPVAHGSYQSNMNSIMKGLSDIVNGESTLGITIKNDHLENICPKIYDNENTEKA